jgi:hypothetical protein
VEQEIFSMKFKEFLNCKNRGTSKVYFFNNYLHKKLSIEYVLEKLLEIDKIQYLCFSENELNYFKLIPNSQIFSNSDSYLQRLYNKFEFFNKRNRDIDINDQNKSSLISDNIKRIFS